MAESQRPWVSKVLYLPFMLMLDVTGANTAGKGTFKLLNKLGYWGHNKPWFYVVSCVVGLAVFALILLMFYKEFERVADEELTYSENFSFNDKCCWWLKFITVISFMVMAGFHVMLDLFGVF